MENFEEVAIFGIPALFTPARIDRSTVPYGCHLYEVRHDDDCQGDAVQIARNICVNHWGSLITRDELEINDGYLDIGPMDLNYGTGDCRSISDFMAKYPDAGRKEVKQMGLTSKLASVYDTGADFWRDNVLGYGTGEAVAICSRYLGINLVREHQEDECRFCREIFAAMAEATKDVFVPVKLVYPYGFEVAKERMETSYYHKNRDMNTECTHAIDAAISESCYKVNHYNLELAAMCVISGHGFGRVNAVLAHQVQKHAYDGRYSGASKKWAEGFNIPDKTHVFLNSHATLVEGFAAHARKLHSDLGTGDSALPGQEEDGRFKSANGYGVIRSFMFSENQGYAIAHNPDAPDRYVCWQFTVTEGGRDYYWGIYGNEQTAIDGYNARLFAKYN